MKAILKDNIIVVMPETDAERQALGDWRGNHPDHVFELADGNDRGLSLHGLGPQLEACREPINVLFEQGDRQWWPISNLAPAQFVLHGRVYASVEGFWQGLKYADDTDRARIAGLSGLAAKRAGRTNDDVTFVYDGTTYVAGTHAHWMLMDAACRAKFAQDGAAQAALLATGNRPLQHRPRRDSRVIPGVIMAEIWMRIRAKLAAPD